MRLAQRTFYFSSQLFSASKLCNSLSQYPQYVLFQNVTIARQSSSSINERKAQILRKGLPKQKAIPGVKNVILVVSCKGGVGKSTTAVNLAVALSKSKGNKVGILDADVFGPSIPTMMGVNYEPYLTKDNKMIPLDNYGVQCMSMGFLVKEESAMIWRGLMVMSALEKLFRQVEWSDIDFLVIDTPPGTGDTLLSIVQNIPISGVVMVSTPRKLDTQVTRRGLTMLEKLSLPIIGVVQNMSSITCPSCQHEIKVFDSGKLSEGFGVPILAEMPLSGTISDGNDSGKPIVIGQPESNLAQKYLELSDKVQAFVQRLSTREE